MKIKRFKAKTMREAMRLVREEQGPEAVILSNHRIPGGVEVVAATDYDAALAQQAARQAMPPVAPAAAVVREEGSAPAPVSPRMEVVHADPAAETTPVAETATATDIAVLKREMGEVRKLMQRQLESLQWVELKQGHPRQLETLRMLAGLGVDADLARAIAAEVPPEANDEQARALPLGLLSGRVAADASDPIMSGGVVALVGPTGVGKTTTIAKLAARFATRFPRRDMALVTLDHYRIGAQEQLYTYGRLLGVPVHSVGAEDNLAGVLDELSDCRLILVDTAGMSQRDRVLERQIERLQALVPRLQAYLVLSASAANSDEVITKFKSLTLAGGILTKLDEASRLGGPLSAVIRHGLPLGYVTDGQRVPEDLHLAHADRLVLRATQLASGVPSIVDSVDGALRYAEIPSSPSWIHA